jgi:hypothetical protein
MMDYDCRLVRRSGGDSYQPARSYEPAVILSSPTVRMVIAITNGFNDTGGDKGVDDRPICSSIYVTDMWGPW